MKKILIAAITIAMLSGCSASEKDRALGLMKEACEIKKDEGNNSYSSDWTKGLNSIESREFWDPRTISIPDLKTKFNEYSNTTKLARQAAALDSTWKDGADSISIATYFIDRAYVARVSGKGDSLTWTDQDFNLPKRRFASDCQTVLDLIN